MGHLRPAWRDLLHHMNKKKGTSLQAFHKQTVGVDLCDWVYSDGKNFTEMFQAVQRRVARYEPAKGLEFVHRRHERLVKNNIDPVYVVDGMKPPTTWDRIRTQNDKEHIQEFFARIANGERYGNAERKTLQNIACRSRMVDNKIWGALVDSMRAVGMKVHCAPYFAVAQLVQMERAGEIDCFFADSAEGAFLGAQKQLLKLKMPRRKQNAVVFNPDRDLSRKQFDFEPNKDFLVELSCLYGNSYIKRFSAMPVKDLVRIIFREFCGEERRHGLGLEYLLRQSSEEYVKQFDRARNNMRYTPVLKEVDGERKLMPLNDLPEGADWSELMGYDPVKHLDHVHDFNAAWKFDNYSGFISRESHEFEIVHPYIFEGKSRHWKPVFPKTTSPAAHVKTREQMERYQHKKKLDKELGQVNLEEALKEVRDADGEMVQVPPEDEKKIAAEIKSERARAVDLSNDFFTVT